MAGKQKHRTDHPNEGIAHLEQVRQRRGWSAHRMAAALEVPFRTYQKWLYTDQVPRHLGALRARADALGGTRRHNCWEIMACGRGPASGSAAAPAPCPAALDPEGHGVNGGVNAGRVCWAVAGTLCGSVPRGTKATTLVSCLGCAFFAQVQREEGLVAFKLLKPGQVYRQE